MMIKTLTELIMDYKSGILMTPNLQIFNKTFLNENIEGGTFIKTVFRDSHLKNIKFTNLNLQESFYYDSSFESCIFNKVDFSLNQFSNCSFENCSFIDCYFNEAELTKIIFKKCKFEVIENPSNEFGYAVLTSCHFDETLLTNIIPESLIATVLIDSKFSTSTQSIEFKGEFYLFDLLHANNGINGILTGLSKNL